MPSTNPPPRRLVLASSSRYRRELLERLGLRVETASPGSDEAPLPGESPSATATRLAILKARAVAGRFPDALIIGSDQVASCEGVILDKPGSHENARRQLTHMSGKTARFYTAVAVLDAASGFVASRVGACDVAIRRLTPEQIQNYLLREQPYDCAGSAKSEGLGIALMESLRTDDPTSLIGLPLIALTELLEQAGLPVLG
ncbi:MAG: septum formation inhibitor Maf [Betaproteobacteria bacterium]|nr:septum formation inhibitor Maf [Betaproteobacteria bacterium]